VPVARGARLPLYATLPGYVVGLATLGVAGGFAAGRLPGTPVRPGWLEVTSLLAYLAVAAGLHLELRIRTEKDLLDLFDAVLLAAVVLLPGPLLVGVVAVAKAAAEAWRRVPLVKGCFNVAQWTMAAAVGSLVFTALRGSGAPTIRDVPAMVAAFTAITIVNTFAVAAVLGLVQGRTAHAMLSGRWADLARAAVVNGLVNLVFGLLFVALWTNVPAATPLLLVLLVAWHRASRGFVSERVGHARVLGLQRAEAAVVGREDPREGLPDFLREIAVAFECEGAVAYLTGPDGQSLRYRHGPRGFDAAVAEPTESRRCRHERDRPACRTAASRWRGCSGESAGATTSSRRSPSASAPQGCCAPMTGRGSPGSKAASSRCSKRLRAFSARRCTGVSSGRR
jgi:hypothetical protein